MRIFAVVDSAHLTFMTMAMFTIMDRGVQVKQTVDTPKVVLLFNYMGWVSCYLDIIFLI